MMTEDKILAIVKNDYEQAKEAKSEIDDNIDTWLKEYNGEPYGNEADGRSKIVMKDIKKAVEWFLPNAIDPFVNKNRLFRLEGVTAEDVDRAAMHEKLLNYQFVRSFNRYSFIEDMFRVGSTEGTTIIQCGWEFKEDVTTEQLKSVSQEQLDLASQKFEVSKVEANNDGTYNATVTSRVTLRNNPTAKVLRNGNCFPDPTCTSIDDANFFIYKEDMSISQLKQMEADGVVQNVDNITESSKNDDVSNLEVQRNQYNKSYGQDSDYESKDEANKKVTVYTYWGNIDANEDGISEPVVVAWVGNTVIRNEENPYPDKKMPFVSIPFTKVPFAFWGKPLAEFLSDNQKIRTSLMRGIIDNVAQSNNGFKFFRKGTIDVFNKKKLLANTGGAIEVNGTQADQWDGSYNQIPVSVFNMFDLVKQESEGLAGYTQGVDPKLLSSTATGVATSANMGDKRMGSIIRSYAEGVKEVARKFMSYNKVYLEPKEVMRISGEYIEFTPDDIDGRFDIDIQVGTDGVDTAKANQITMLMQQIGALAGTVDPLVLNKLLAKLADIWGFPDVSMELENFKPQPPSEEQMRAAQLEIEKLQAEVEKLKSETMRNMADANQKNVDAKKSAYGIIEPEAPSA